jgi:ADP-ribose pyrophosphatase YjhB (NUDIX family)
LIELKFCNQCGSNVELRIPDGDNLPRHVCGDCGEIHYQNPKIVAGCIPVWNDQVLLCKRAIEPRYGLWTIPAGFMENRETVEQAAARETQEEACADVTIDGLYGVFSVPHISQVYMVFRGDIANGKFAPGIESLETALYHEHEIPWDELAFPVVIQALKRFFSDRQRGDYTPFHEQVEPRKLK